MKLLPITTPPPPPPPELKIHRTAPIAPLNTLLVNQLRTRIGGWRRGNGWECGDVGGCLWVWLGEGCADGMVAREWMEGKGMTNVTEVVVLNCDCGAGGVWAF